MVDHTTKRHTFQAFTSFLLTHYRCPERHIHEKMKEMVLLSAILILPVTLAPPTGFHASKKRNRPARHKKIEFSCLLAGDFNHPMNYCFQILESIGLAICFLSCFSVNACRSNRARVSASSSLLLCLSLGHFSQVLQTFSWRPCLLRVDHSSFCTLAFDSNSSAVHESV